MRNIKLISLIALALLIVGVIGSVFTFNSVHQSDWLTKEEIIPSEGIENLDILTNNTKIEVLPTNDSDITAELSTKSKKHELLVKVEDSTLFIEVKDKQRSFISLDFFSFGTTLVVYVPEKAYDSLQVESDNGRITIDEIEANDVNIKADNGRIELENIESTTVTGEASNGLISMKNINSSTINVNTSNGKIMLDHVEGEIFGRTSNGTIELVTKDLDRFIELETNNGKINVQTELEPTNVTFDVRVDNGKARVFGESNWDTVVGNGENLVKLKTNNGGITVTK